MLSLSPFDELMHVGNRGQIKGEVEKNGAGPAVRRKLQSMIQTVVEPVSHD